MNPSSHKDIYETAQNIESMIGSLPNENDADALLRAMITHANAIVKECAKGAGGDFLSEGYLSEKVHSLVNDLGDLILLKSRGEQPTLREQRKKEVESYEQH